MYIVTHRKLFFWITGLILAAAVGAIAFWGLPLGIDFTGGSLTTVSYPAGVPSKADIQAELAPLSLGPVAVQSSGSSAVAIRTRTLAQAEHDALVDALAAHASTTVLSYTSVGPALGSQFTHKALWAILAVVLAIVLYIAFAFRKVSGPVPGWSYGLTVVAMLAIDIIVPAGFYAAYCRFTGAEVDSLFVVAMLALLGYVVNDIIVIFDRVRENLSRDNKLHKKETFAETVGRSIDETMARSINTSLTVILALLVLILFGAESTRTFALVMLVGVAAGTFSSIARSAPLLIPIADYFARKRAR
jgi:preprotein translocase subunit SecF